MDKPIKWGYIKFMDITFDPARRVRNLADRGLDFARAFEVFANRTAEVEDTRRDYGEWRFITAGPLADRIVVIVWTPRDGSRRIISMRFAHEREQALWRQLIG